MSFNGSLLFEPWEIKSKIGNPLKFYSLQESLLSKGIPEPVNSKPSKLLCPTEWPVSQSIDKLKLIENKSWSIKFHNYWDLVQIKQRKLEIFKSDALHNYNINRDIPSIEGTSKLSPHLRFGEISPKSS